MHAVVLLQTVWEVTVKINPCFNPKGFLSSQPPVNGFRSEQNPAWLWVFIPQVTGTPSLAGVCWLAAVLSLHYTQLCSSSSSCWTEGRLDAKVTRYHLSLISASTPVVQLAEKLLICHQKASVSNISVKSNNQRYCQECWPGILSPSV